MKSLPLRLHPGQDLRAALLAAAPANAFVLQGIGSLSVAMLRFAGASAPTRLEGDMEILTLAGSLSAGGAHLHMSVSDAQGAVLGGHVSAGCIVRTTVEVLIAVLEEHELQRAHDPATGYDELVIHDRSG